jgi:glycosyltransferase involved in cell wall biosynthesis
VKVSGCVIAKDEADRIEACLASLSFCDEVLVLDSGSRDGTQEICRRLGARVVETDWPGWIAQKNRAAETAAHDWVLSIDADERIDDGLRDAIQALRASGPGAERPAAYEVRRRVWYLGRWLKHGGLYPEWRARLFDRRRARWGGTDPHDHLLADGPVERIRSGHLEHHSFRSLTDHMAKMNRFSSVAAEEMARKGRRTGVAALLLRPTWHFFRTYVLRLGFLDGKPGLIYARVASHYVLAKYAKLWELSRTKPESPAR